MKYFCSECGANLNMEDFDTHNCIKFFVKRINEIETKMK